MSERQTHRPVAEDQRAPEHLSNERTFLAWVRTSIALLSLGFVLARVGPSLAERSAASSSHAPRAVPVGISLITLGALLTVLAAWRHSRVNREIENGMQLVREVVKRHENNQSPNGKASFGSFIPLEPK